MPVAEISAALISLRAALDITKAMIGLRDAEAFRSKSIELQVLILESLDKAIESREAYSAQLDRVRALEAEVTSLKDWNAEKQNYELKTIGRGVIAYMLQHDKRSAEQPHWLCPNCFANGEKAFFQATPASTDSGRIYKCAKCQTLVSLEKYPEWQD
jgi:hypothetical protein